MSTITSSEEYVKVSDLLEICREMKTAAAFRRWYNNKAEGIYIAFDEFENALRSGKFPTHRIETQSQIVNLKS